MPKNLIVEDVKPSNQGVFDISPKNLITNDIKPKNQLVVRDLTTVSYQVVLGARIPIGLLLALTYPEQAGTVTQWSEKG